MNFKSVRVYKKSWLVCIFDISLLREVSFQYIIIVEATLNFCFCDIIISILFCSLVVAHTSYFSERMFGYFKYGQR